MFTKMHLQRRLPGESFAAPRTLERFLAGVNARMRFQTCVGEEILFAVRALVQFGAYVHFYV
jgi:hypothetical protein